MDKNEQLAAIQDIRKMMNRSIRFLSLSGLSGLFAGCYALIAGFIVYKYTQGNLLHETSSSIDTKFLVIVACATLFLSVVTSYILTRRKAKKDGAKLWDESAKNAIINLCIPLIAGGILSLAFIYHGFNGLLVPTTLIFYGLALISASKFTFPIIWHLGILEIILGLINSFFIDYGLVFWLTGFGLLHIIYGIFMYYKYEHK